MGKVVYDVLIESMSKHVAENSKYFEGSTIWLLAWVHESLGYTTHILVYPRVLRWITSNIPKYVKEARIRFSGIKVDEVTDLIAMCDEEHRLLQSPDFNFYDPLPQLRQRRFMFWVRKRGMINRK